jgi:hypothetical protein
LKPFSVAVLSAILVAALSPGRALVVRDAVSGRPASIVPIAIGETFAVTYVHSIYRQPALEEFVVRDEGFALTRIASRSEAVLEYYARSEPVQARDGAFELRPQPGLVLSVLPLLASTDGARTLEYLSLRIPLFRHGAHVTLSCESLPRAAIWMKRLSPVR